MCAKHALKLFRDPVHDVISHDRDTPLGRLMMRLIDGRTMQRLRHIRQLGLASLVYPSAEHSRFAHSLGVAHFAKRFCEKIHRGSPLPEAEVMATCAAALLHDSGHAPFSHAFESILGEVLGLDGHHESYTQQVILWEEGDVYRALSEFDPQLPRRVVSYIDHSCEHYTAPIVSSQLDADRMDYLLRDGHMTGVKNYHYDAERILEMLQHDEEGLIVHRRALQAVESYLLSRFHMYQQVYYHKVLRISEGTIAAIFRRVLDLLRDQRASVPLRGPLAALFESALTHQEVDLRAYLSITDHHVWVAFEDWSVHRDPVLSDLCSRLLQRRLLKSVEIPEHALAEFNASVRPTLDAQIEAAGYSARYYVLFDQAEDLPFRPYDANHDTTSEAIRIDMGAGRILPIEQVSPLARSLGEIHYRITRYCFPEEVRSEVEATLQRHRFEL